ncbi:hypothetical protein SAMN04487914_111122 [Arthrobacter sp. ok909]|uniref:DUF5677 domain-containing protein n=1 Tax=Arthrobacter sp. ok909 TaxID=1761746 RepID=UPI00087F3837|nr:DUF5677 domain-containing protein [Arthrobacter sp. ok909]SDP44146.1 hypothetical protein SAMN04487914_111122 [Arthrobacter sp. ok909]
MDAQRQKAFRRIFFNLKSIRLHGPEPASLEIEDIDRDEFNNWSAVAVAWGWTTRVARSCEAAIRMSDNGFDEEAAPLLRSATEHAMWLWWIRKDGGKVLEALQRQQATSLQKLLGAQEIGWTLDSPILDNIDALIGQATRRHAELDAFAHLSHLAKRYRDDLGNLYQAWLVDTQNSHPTLQSGAAYFKTLADGQPQGPGFRLLHKSDSQEHNIAAKAVIMFHVALTAYSAVAGLDDYYLPKLDRVTEQIGQLSRS